MRALSVAQPARVERRIFACPVKYFDVYEVVCEDALVLKMTRNNFEPTPLADPTSA